MKRVLLYPGCLILYRFPEYEYTSKLLLETLNISTETLDNLVCCGAYMQGSSANWEYLAAYNMSLAEANNLDIITLCGGCTNVFKRLKHKCQINPEKQAELNVKLGKIGLEFRNEVKVKHLFEIITDNYEQLAKLISKSVDLNIAAMYPCQLFYPSEIIGFDPIQAQNTLEGLAQLSNCNIINYPQENDCCGSSLINVNPDIAHKLGKNRLETLEEKDAQVIVTACGNCHVLLDRMQKEYHQGRQIPAMFISQFIGLILGWNNNDLRIKSPLLRRVIKNV